MPQLQVFESVVIAFNGPVTKVRERLFFKTGLRLPVEGGKAVLRSETEADFGRWSSAFSVDLDGQYDCSVRVTYVLASALRLQTERQAAHTADQTAAKAPARSTLDLVQLIYNF